MATDKMAHIHLKNLAFDEDMNSIVTKVQVKIVEEMEAAIVKACIEAARAKGMNDLFLMDKQFVLDALTEKLKRSTPAKLMPISVDPADPYFSCTACHHGHDPVYYDFHEYKFCPYCGMPLEGDEDDSC